MKKHIAIFLLFIPTLSHCTIFGITDSIFKKQTNEIKTELSAIKEANLNNNMELGTIKNTMRDLQVSVGQVQNSLSVSAINNSKNSSNNAGRDQNITNDTKIFEIQKEMYEAQIKVWKYLFYAICVLIVSPLLGLVSWTIKALFKEMSDARFYQTSLAKVSEQDTFDSIMTQKKEIDKQKTIIAKFKQAKEMIMKKEGV